MSNPISRNAETRDLRNLEQETDNIYLSAIIISKRANQIAEKQKEELRNRLEPFLNDSDNLEEIQENREQIEISMMYERMPKPTLLATQEFSEEKTYWRIPDAPEKPL
jgi:DNA-directed RNA polymerase subunit K/omega